GEVMDVDPDIGKALTPPCELYFDPRQFAAQREKVFARSWIPIGAAADVAAPGVAKAVTLLPGCLDEPLLLVNAGGTAGGAGGGTLRLLSNVCTHRGHLVVAPQSDARNLKSLRCPYHGRSFALDGRCLAAPGFESAPNFPRKEDSLASASLG